jgi:hypothetical protein
MWCLGTCWCISVVILAIFIEEGYASTMGNVESCIPRNSIWCVGCVMPMSLDFLNSIPRSYARWSMRWQASWSRECVGVAISMSSM